jgi:catechol 2,3-dioxygenase-like lactoylglutathione lyase family enzyme
MAPEIDPALRKISAISLFVEDLKATKEFYADVFGVAAVFEDDACAVMQFENLLINLLKTDNALEIVAPGAVGGRQSGSRFQLSIWLQDVDAVSARLRARGVTLNGPIDRPWGKRTVNFLDPAGHSWEVAQDI